MQGCIVIQLKYKAIADLHDDVFWRQLPEFMLKIYVEAAVGFRKQLP